MSGTSQSWDPPDPVIEPPALVVQTVLYRPDRRELESLVRGIRSAARLALQREAYGSISVAFGDCSPHPSISREQEGRLADEMSAFGISSFRYEFYDENRGSAEGHNSLFALRAAGTDFIFVMNPDVYLAPDVLSELVHPFGDPNVGIVEARQLPVEHQKAFDPADGSTDWASGACMMVREGVLQQIIGFDSDSFFLYCDDVDFSWRARLAGFRIVHQPSARVFHDKRLHADGKLSVTEIERYNAEEAALLMAWKYSRPDLVDEWSEWMMQTGLPEHRSAVAAFEERRQTGRLPTPIDPHGTVAEFSFRSFGRHRYEVSV
jgi:hypothetical protein